MTDDNSRIARGGTALYGASVGIIPMLETRFPRIPCSVACWFQAGLLPRDFGPPGSRPRR